MRKKYSLFSLGLMSLSLFFGYEISLREDAQQRLDGMTQKVREASEDTQQKMTDIKENVVETKEKIDQKIQDIETAVEAVNTVFEGKETEQ